MCLPAWCAFCFGCKGFLASVVYSSACAAVPRSQRAVATLLVKKILAENDDRKAFGAKVEELTAVFDKRRGLIQDLRNGAIDLDTLWQDATRAFAQNRR